MKDLEILNRASAFIVKTKDREFAKKCKYHVITASHVAAPWRWPKYYPDEWIQFINESHTHYTMELSKIYFSSKNYLKKRLMLYVPKDTKMGYF